MQVKHRRRHSAVAIATAKAVHNRDERDRRRGSALGGEREQGVCLADDAARNHKNSVLLRARNIPTHAPSSNSKYMYGP